MTRGYISSSDVNLAIGEITDHINRAKEYRYSKYDLSFFNKFLSDLNKAKEEKKGLLITD